jgi:hypothetical protein
MPLAIAGLWIDKLRRDNASRGADLTSNSRKTVIDKLDAAAIVLDMKGKVVEINPPRRAIIHKRMQPSTQADFNAVRLVERCRAM